MIGALVACLGESANADEVVHAYYSARTDQIVVTIAYLGAVPDHTFLIRWDSCREPSNTGRAINAELVDDQLEEAGGQRFTTVRRFDLASVSCRPAKLTLTITSNPGFSLWIPARTLFSP